MANKINTSDTFQSLLSQVESELLDVLLEPEDTTYPWNPGDDETEAYFDELERQFASQDLIDEDLTTRSQTFYNQLDNLWSKVSTNLYYKCNTSCVNIDSLKETLQTVFTNCIPQSWLNEIAQKAAEIFTPQQSMSDQLVQCVQAVLPTWAADDLFVLARPFAYAMRSSEPQNMTTIVSKLENRDWSTLSEIEQARISIAIAYYALKQIDNLQSEA